MADIDPGVCEQVLHFEREDFIVDVDVAMNLGLSNQISDSLGICAVSGHRHLLSISKRVAHKFAAYSITKTMRPQISSYSPLGWVRNSSRISIGGWT